MTDIETQNTMPSDEPTIETFYEKLDELNALTKWFNRQGKAIIRKNTKTTRRRNPSANQKSGFSVPVKIADILANFLQVDPTDHMPRTEVTKRLTTYIKSNQLQCENKKHFVCDEALAKVFSIETGTQTNWFEMQKFLAKLLTSVKKDATNEETSGGEKRTNAQSTTSPSPPLPSRIPSEAPTPEPASEAPQAPKKKLKKMA